MLVFAAVDKNDTAKDAESMAGKLLKVKLWDDPDGEKKWKKNVTEIEGEVLCGMSNPSPVDIIKPATIKATIHSAPLPYTLALTPLALILQSPNSPSWPPQKRATSPTSTNLPRRKKAKNSTTPSSSKSARYTVKIASKTASLAP